MSVTANKFYMISIFMHMLLLLALLPIQLRSRESVKIGDEASKWVASYIAHDKKQSVAKKHQTILKQTSQSPIHRVTQKSSQYSVSHQGAKQQVLLQLLHAAIQKEQHYPEGALQMERQGSATLSFILFPDGRIANLRIVRSSGTDSLDHAAIAAVQNAVPFADVDDYLQESKAFNIDVVFKL